MVGNKVRKRNPTLVVDEIEQILSYGINRINVADDLFVSSPRRVKAVCEEIIRRKLRFSWSAFARVNTVDRETLLLMRETGCDGISFGVETGNPEMIERIRKRITLDQARNAVSLCREVGIIPHTSFIVGLPGETPETLRETEEFASRLGSLYGYHLLAPFPGTTVREDVTNYDLQIMTDDWTKYDANSAIVRTAALSPEDMDTFVADFEGRIATVWEEMVEGYHNKTNTPEIDMQVAGHFRMKLVYRLLSEDLIENLGVVEDGGADAAGGSDPAAAAGLRADRAEGELCRRIGAATGVDALMITETIRDFIEKGYLYAAFPGDSCVWRWSHNNQNRRGPQEAVVSG
jgi:hypothetical protein